METESKNLDCTLPMRRYILKTKQSAWSKSTRRIIVWSPCQTLPSSKNAIDVPTLRHYPRQNHQDVRVLSTNDVEKDSSTVYQREKVSTQLKPKAAHGVAIVDSALGHDFIYKRGDKFWLQIETRKPETMGTLAAPVINLRTYQEGTISTQHVCWYPLARSSSGELWTFGGMEREVRGEKKQTWIWAVIQSTGSKSTVCDMVQAAPDCEIKFSERASIFKERLEVMEGQVRKKSSTNGNSMPHSYRFVKLDSPLDAIRRVMADSLKRKISESAPISYSFSEACALGHSIKRRRICLPAVRESSDGGRPTMIGRLPSPPQSRKYSAVSYIMSPQIQLPDTPNSADGGNDEVVSSVAWSLHSAKPLNKPFLAADQIAHDPTLIRAAHDRVRQHAKNSNQIGEYGSAFWPKALESKDEITEETTKLAGFCSNSEPQCFFTQLRPPHRRRAHIHLSAAKCKFTHFDPGGTHIHCVTFHNWPGGPGDKTNCVYNSREYAPDNSVILPAGKDHTSCCRWTAKDVQDSGYYEEQERAKNFVHPCNQEIKFRGKKRKEMWKLGITGMMPPVINRREFVKYPDPTQATLDALMKDGKVLSEADLAGADLLMNFAAKASKDSSLVKAVTQREGLAREREKTGSFVDFKMQDTLLTAPQWRNFPEQQIKPAQRRLPEQHATHSQQIVNPGAPWRGNGVSNIHGTFPADFNYTIRHNNNTPVQYPNSAKFPSDNSWTAKRSSNELSNGAGNAGMFGLPSGSPPCLPTGFHNSGSYNIAQGGMDGIIQTGYNQPLFNTTQTAIWPSLPVENSGLYPTGISASTTPVPSLSFSESPTWEAMPLELEAPQMSVIPLPYNYDGMQELQMQQHYDISSSNKNTSNQHQYG